MNIWLLWILIGLGVGLFVVPIVLWIFNLIRNTIERRKVKKMIMTGEFLTPMDLKDYNSKAWENQIKHNPEDLKKLNMQLFENSNKEPQVKNKTNLNGEIPEETI